MEKIIDASAWMEWDRFYRANFINSLSGYKSACLIGSMNTENKICNVAIFSNIVHLGAHPPLIGILNRPLEAAKDTKTNFETSGYCTLNLINEKFIEAAHQTSAKYSSHISEYDACGFTPEFINNANAPYIAESKIKFMLAYKRTIPIEENGTFFMIGEIIEIVYDDSIVTQDGFLHLQEAEIICSLGIDAYYKPQFINRYSYAKPDVKATVLKHE
jgi:flavin reductase (DIM6/NTAB) family NADH-FMN oxidoreductase RutF